MKYNIAIKTNCQIGLISCPWVSL